MTDLILLLLRLLLLIVFRRTSLFYVNLWREREKQRTQFTIVLVSYLVTAAVKNNLLVLGQDTSPNPYV